MFYWLKSLQTQYRTCNYALKAILSYEQKMVTFSVPFTMCSFSVFVTFFLVSVTYSLAVSTKGVVPLDDLTFDKVSNMCLWF